MWLVVLPCLLLLSWTVTAEQFYIIPSNRTECPRDPCYTLTDVVQDSSQFFTSNTVIIFLPGYHQAKTTRELSVLIKNVRNISMIGYNQTNSDSKSVIQCTGSLGFVFINVTTLKIAKLVFSFCGAGFLSNITIKEFVYPHDYEAKISSKQVSSVTFYFLQTINVTISEVTISNSAGAGLLGINMLGLSNISQTTLSGNKPNCLILFLDNSFTSEIFSPTVFNIVDSWIAFGSTYTNKQGYHRLDYATGLNIELSQTTYKVHICINNIKTSNNTGKTLYGNVHFVIENWMCHCSVIQAERIVSTNTAGKYDIVHLNYGNSSLCTSTCLPEENYMVHISESHFVGSGVRVAADQGRCDAWIELQSIKVQNRTRFSPLLVRNMISIKLQDITCIYNLMGIIVSNSNITVYGNNCFAHNIGHNNIIILVNSIISFHGDTKIIASKVERGGAIFAINSTVIFQQIAELVENEGRAGGAVALYKNSQLVVEKQSKVTFQRNHAEQNGGAVLADASSIVVQENANVTFIGNEGINGGAVVLQNGATLSLGLHSQMIFIRNHAQHYGGALCVNRIKSKVHYRIVITCFFYTRFPSLYKKLPATSLPKMVFQNNTGGSAGSSIYGGWVDLCTKLLSTHTQPDFDAIFHIENASKQLSAVSSNPTRVCLCTDGLPDCNITQYNVTAYPGETFQIPAVAVGQRFGTVPYPVESRFTSVHSSSPPQMKPLQGTQRVRGVCTKLSYTILSRHQKEEMVLSVDKSNLPYKNAADLPSWALKAVLLQFTDLRVYIWLHPCPLGFVLYNSSCTCHPQLQQHEISCNIDTQNFRRPSPMWINVTVINASQNGIILHEHCPFDYCKPESFDLNLEDPDEQCAFNRSGILCGACQQNLSHVFGTSACRDCSSLWALLWVPLIALAGVALVVLLIVLNLTVSVGTINGLIFYANIVRANHATFFPSNITNSFLSWFIAWINLDLGIETCFYSGLDAYVKTWLQFVFPLYIWFLVIMIIVLSHYYTLAARLSGRNAVPVLATLFLTSYAKLFRIIITVFQATELEYSNTFVKKVWLYDGNVDYLKGKHTPLFIAALLLLFLSLPYTAILIFIQRLQHWSSYRVLFWVKRLKPLFDAYTGPYKDRHRYWTGLLLLVRIVLFLIFSLNIRGSSDINLLAISLTVLSLFMHGVLFGTVYKTWSLNVIEYSFFFNLGVLASVTLYMTDVQQGQLGVVYASVSIAFTQFIIIVTFHALQRFRSSHHCNRIYVNLVTKLKVTRSALKQLIYKPKNPHHNTQPRVTHTRIELRESLLEYCS